jgi:hypothetical protein
MLAAFSHLSAHESRFANNAPFDGGIDGIAFRVRR